MANKEFSHVSSLCSCAFPPRESFLRTERSTKPGRLPNPRRNPDPRLPLPSSAPQAAARCRRPSSAPSSALAPARRALPPPWRTIFRPPRATLAACLAPSFRFRRPHPPPAPFLPGISRGIVARAPSSPPPRRIVAPPPRRRPATLEVRAHVVPAFLASDARVTVPIENGGDGHGRAQGQLPAAPAANPPPLHVCGLSARTSPPSPGPDRPVRTSTPLPPADTAIAFWRGDPDQLPPRGAKPSDAGSYHAVAMIPIPQSLDRSRIRIPATLDK